MSAGETEPQEQFRRVCRTALSQRHLTPFPLEVQPVHWEYDGTLSLFPQPHALVMPMAGLMHSLDLDGVRCGPLHLVRIGVHLNWGTPGAVTGCGCL